jgi:membrane protein
MERGRELQTGIKAEETIQLPPRDVRKSEKDSAKAARQVAEARELRERSGSS